MQIADFPALERAASFRNCRPMFNPRQTIVRQIAPEHPSADVIAQAAEILRGGGLVAFPTETVYGLGANALDAKAVESIFQAKGRPSTNPIIVHVASAEAARKLVLDWPPIAGRLAERFWPGPLTLVLPKRSIVPDIVTAGGPTIGIRVPAHPVALALLVRANLPIAAPSANRSAEISPTTADHVRRALDGRIDFILDAGPTPGGLESTVLDLTVDPARVLRPGLVTIAQLEAVIGKVSWVEAIRDQVPFPRARSPGLLDRHYAPRARLKCVDRKNESAVQELLAMQGRVGWLRLQPNVPANVPTDAMVIDMPCDPAAYSARLYAALHDLDDAGVDEIIVDLPPEGDAWLAVHDRLRRASAK
jgi:L-threonylcarbamoyladenylate synthase